MNGDTGFALRGSAVFEPRDTRVEGGDGSQSVGSTVGILHPPDDAK